VNLTRDGLAAAGPKSTFSRINQPPDPSIVKYLGADRLDLEEIGR
jgi:hypothetical protein